MQPKKQFRPANLRTLLGFLLVVIVLGGSAIFYWGLGLVRDYATEVNQTVVDADASANQIQELQTLKAQLAQSNSLVEKANQLFSTPDAYQARALSDVTNYANAAGLSIANTSSDGESTPGAHTLTVTFKNPVSYSKLITFLSNVESNLPKLQVSSLSLNRSGGGADSVSVSEIKIDISVR